VPAAPPTVPAPPPLGPPFTSFRRLRALLWKSSVEAEVESELAFHLEMRILDYQARGMDAVEARAAALARFGDVAKVAGACRDLGRDRERGERRRQWLAELGQDLRFAGRQLAGAPGFTAAAVLILGIGIGAAAATFGVVDAILLRPLPLAAPERLVHLWTIPPAVPPAVAAAPAPAPATAAGGLELPVSEPDFLDWRRASRSFAAMAAFEARDRNFTAGNGSGAVPGGPSGGLPGGGVLGGVSGGRGEGVSGAPERVRAVRVTANVFPLLGVAPALGRTFAASEDERGNPHRVVVLADRFWRRRFEADPEVLGRDVALDGVDFRVVGVMPRGFELPAQADLWLPLVPDPGPARQTPRDHRSLEVVARLLPGISAARAAGELAALAGELARRYPETNRGWGAGLATFADWVRGPRLRARAALSFAAVALLWLAAGANVASLLLVRAAARQREMDIRAALGAGRARILRQLLTESLLLAALGAVAGLLLAGGALAAIRRLSAGFVAGQPALHPLLALRTVAPDARLLLFTVAVTLLTGFVFGIVPALQASRPGIFDTLRQGVRMSPPANRRGREALILVQATLAMVLLVGAGLILHSFLRLLAADPGFDPARVTAIRLALTGDRYDPASRRRFMRAFEQRLARLPGVVAVGVTSAAPWSETRPSLPFLLRREDGGELLSADWRSVSPGLLRSLGMSLRRGRWLAETDREGAARVAVIDETMAWRWWPGEDPVGRRIAWGLPGRPLTIVGVVGALRDMELEGPPRPTLFLPYAQWPWRSMMVLVKSRGPASAAGAAALVRREILALDPQLPVSPPRVLAASRAELETGARFALLPLLLFAAAALVLAAGGIYGATASTVTQRRREIGIRLALGAQASGVLRVLLSRGLLLTLAGAALGALATLALAPALSLLLFGITPLDAAAYIAGSALLAATLAGASLLAARRATRLQPLLALRGE
jgi:putative ABC transport system permease protein